MNALERPLPVNLSLIKPLGAWLNCSILRRLQIIHNPTTVRLLAKGEGSDLGAAAEYRQYPWKDLNPKPFDMYLSVDT